MKEVKYTCDICNKEYKSFNNNYSFLHLSLLSPRNPWNYSVYDFHRGDDPQPKQQDVCENCQKKIFEFILIMKKEFNNEN